MKLLELRKKQNLTQTDLAKMLNITQRTYSGYELGQTEPTIETLCKLADFYHCSLDELVGRETDVINLNVLEPEVSTIIRKIIKMNNMQKAQTINFIGALTMFDN